MKGDSVTDALLREFLLGKLADADRERMEGLFLTDSATRERVLALEQDLIDDYLEDSLSQEDKERFLSRYAQTDEQRRKLRITGAIKDWAVREARAPHPAAPTVSVRSRIWTWLRLKPRFIVPIAITIVIAIVLAIVWLNSREEQRKHLAIEQELAQLNSPASMREVPPEMTSFDLRPVSVRSIKPQAELKISAEIRLIELQLPWIQNERYSMYQAVVRRVSDRESFTISNLQAESNGRYTIRLRLPAQMLTRGDYQINLIGVAADGSASSSEEYSFFVAD
jgi:anti-sigma factor RsiW